MLHSENVFGIYTVFEKKCLFDMCHEILLKVYPGNILQFIKVNFLKHLLHLINGMFGG